MNSEELVDIVFRLFSLAFPCTGTERQAAAENVGSSRAPVLAVDLGDVIGGERVHVRVFLVADVSLNSRSAWPRLPFLPAGCSSQGIQPSAPTRFYRSAADHRW